MLRQASGWIVLVGLSVGCGSAGGSTAQPDGEAGSSEGRNGPSSEANPLEASPLEASAPEDRSVRYQFVGTPEGMTVEAVSGTQVQTYSCPTHSCTGLCDECAARACEASGELAGACARLLRDCTDTCSCNAVEGAAGANCGFPVCALNRNLCYIGSSDDPSTPGTPGGPQPDPNPTDSAIRPSSEPNRVPPSATPGSSTPGSATPGSSTPGSATPGSATPGSATPGSAGSNTPPPAG